jgi:hypothetical protein
MKKFVFILFAFFSTFIFSQHTYFYEATIDTNNILLRSSNIGNCEGAKWLVLPDTGNTNDGIIYDHGPWLVGKINDDSVLAIIQWSLGWSYSPGPIIDGGAAMLTHPEDSLKYRVYKISKGDDNTNPDYAEWPDEFGAPLDEQGNPQFYGDQTLWTVYNSYDSTAILNYVWKEDIDPIPIEIQQLVYAHGGIKNDDDDVLSNVIFYEWTIINRGEDPIDSVYFGLWSDIDFMDLFDDNLPGVDTINQIGYCWASNETYYGVIPPAVGYVLLYGPKVPSPGKTAVFKGRKLIDHTNLKLNAFKGIADDSIWGDSLYAPVYSITEAQNIARGLTSNGYPIINPITNQVTTFPFSGDPVTGEGWIYTHWISGGAGMVYFSGPFTLAPNDTQWTMIAVIPGLGESNLNSITQMRRKAGILHSLPYDSLAFGSSSYPLTDVEYEEIHFVSDFRLEQNYPNPFNPSTKIKFEIPGQARNDNAIVTLKVYDILGNEITTLVNEELPAGEYEVEFLPESSIKHPASSVYFYQLRAGSFIQTRKMVYLK